MNHLIINPVIRLLLSGIAYVLIERTSSGAARLRADGSALHSIKIIQNRRVDKKRGFGKLRPPDEKT